MRLSDYKIASKALTERLKKSVMNKQLMLKRDLFAKQVLVSDIIEVCYVFNIDGFLVTMDIANAFDSLNHLFLLAALKKIGFGSSFINWIEAILNKLESCVINSRKTTQYFQLKSVVYLLKFIFG